MANESVWYQVGRAIRELIMGAAKSKTEGGSAGGGSAPQAKTAPKTAEKRASTAKPKLKPKATAGARSTTDRSTADRSGADLSGAEPSPGQSGSGQTRDITAAELRKVRLEYAPRPDGDPDPGEVIWTWVPYVENDGRGKDRPVLIIGRIDAQTVVGCYLSTKDHRGFIPLGTGGWDPERRESYLSPERLLRVTHGGMRREGVQIDRKRFETAIAGVLAFHGLK